MRWALLAAVLSALAAGLWLTVGGGNSRQSRRARTAKAHVPAHPQVVEPAAGVAAGGDASPTANPVGDPTARAPSLVEVKRELMLLNLCGGATSSAFSQPVVTSSGPDIT